MGIHEGNVDIVADVMFPADTDDSIAKVMSDFYDRMEATVTSNRYVHILENPRTADLNTPEERAAYQEKISRDDDKRFLVMDSQARLRRLKKVGFWSISLAIQALFMGMAGNVA